MRVTERACFAAPLLLYMPTALAAMLSHQSALRAVMESMNSTGAEELEPPPVGRGGLCTATPSV